MLRLGVSIPGGHVATGAQKQLSWSSDRVRVDFIRRSGVEQGPAEQQVEELLFATFWHVFPQEHLGKTDLSPSKGTVSDQRLKKGAFSLQFPEHLQPDTDVSACRTICTRATLAPTPAFPLRTGIHAGSDPELQPDALRRAGCVRVLEDPGAPAFTGTAGRELGAPQNGRERSGLPRRG